MNQYGFPRTSAKAAKRVYGFPTGDMVRAVVRSGKKADTHVGRVAVRSSDSFNISTSAGTLQGISFRQCTLLQHLDGYAYSYTAKGEALPTHA